MPNYLLSKPIRTRCGWKVYALAAFNYDGQETAAFFTGWSTKSARAARNHARKQAFAYLGW